jgi:peptidyl-prolyl cis-trans isomerase A (cyclophilin A)
MSGIGRRTLLGGAGLALSLPALARPARGLAATAKPRVVLKTDHGTIVVELEDRRAPLTSQNFLRYVDAGKYDDGAFYRAARTPGVPGDGTIVARPSAKSHPFPPIGHESTTMTGLRHRAGTISLGRFAPGSATADFFICAADEPYLDAHPEAKGDNLGYAAFGQVVSGMGTVKRILAAHCSRKAPFPEQRGQWLDPPVAILSAKRAA